MPEPPKATVAILTFNGERYLESILAALEAQEFPPGFETLVIDSGSTDRTLEIVRAHPGVRLHEIPNEAFGHGKTRNLAAALAEGELIAYLTHDAVPRGTRWLLELTAPFEDPKVAAVLARQIARESAPPALKYDIQRVFARQGKADEVTIHEAKENMSENERAIAGFYSDVACATRAELLRGELPYKDVAYAEDQVFGRELISKGYRKAYSARAVIEHSNDGGLRDFGRRVVADLVGLRNIGTEVKQIGRVKAFALWGKWSLIDSLDILRDRDYSIWRKLYWLCVNPAYQAVKWSNFRKASTK